MIERRRRGVLSGGAIMHALALAALAASIARADVVQRRGAADPLEGTVTVGPDGARVRTATNAIHVVPWDRVRAVETDDPALRVMVERWAETADALWRARSRVERQDTMSAEPLFVRAFEETIGTTHETALVVAEGVLRCRLARGANDEAIIPALECIRLRAAGVQTDSYAALPPVHDAATGVLPMLPPWFVETRTIRRSVRRVEAYLSTHGTELTMAIGQQYLDALRRTAALPNETMPRVDDDVADDPGVVLLTVVRDAIHGDAATRRAARSALEPDLLNVADPWRQVWARYATGLSLASEEGEGRRERGLIMLLSIPASRAYVAPYITGLALDRAATHCAAHDMPHGAASLRLELAQRFPGHPVLAHDPDSPAPR